MEMRSVSQIYICVPLMEKKSGSQIFYLFCAPNSGSQIYILCVPNGNEDGKEEWLVDFNYCVSLMEKKSGSQKILYLLCP